MPPVPSPDRARPTIPDGYGLPTAGDGMLDWEQVESRLRASRHYWLATVRPDGTPHSVPRWGVWLDGAFHYDGAPTTRHVRNLAHNTACTLTLESGTEVAIVEGNSLATRADPDGLGARLAAAFGKYHPEYAPAPTARADAQGGGLRVVVPTRGLAWFDFPQDCTRFRARAAEPAAGCAVPRGGQFCRAGRCRPRPAEPERRRCQDYLL